jgi:pyridoxal phosphate enzyme (YggS family)
MSLATQIEQITSQIPPHVTLIAVTKTKPVSLLQEAYDCGLRIFGENKVQEMVDKYEQLPKTIQWHLIGHLQSNKVKYIAPFVTLIHSVDSLKLLQEINKQAQKVNRCIDCLLQIYIAQEDTKFGLSKTELFELLADPQFAALTNVRVVGLMGMATNTENTAQIRQEFRSLKTLFEEVSSQFTAPNIHWQHISMGMSGDYEMAIAEGSTMVRIGSAIFGHRG